MSPLVCGLPGWITQSEAVELSCKPNSAPNVCGAGGPRQITRNRMTVSVRPWGLPDDLFVIRGRPFMARRNFYWYNRQRARGNAQIVVLSRCALYAVT